MVSNWEECRTNL